MKFLSRFVMMFAAGPMLSFGTPFAGEREGAIIGGQNAKPSMFPWACALFYDGSFICSSSLISDMDILTAAHCIVIDNVQQPASLYHAICNVNKSADSVKVDFSDVTVNPGYDPDTLSNDIAVLNAKQPIRRSESVQPICLAEENTPQQEYKLAIAMGWGQTNRGSPPEYPDILQWVRQIIVGNGLCSQLFAGINDNKICATGPFNGICFGDSGGPLVNYPLLGPPVQIGVTSFLNAKFGCGRLYPAVFSRVSEYTEFLKEASSGELCMI